MSEVIKSIDPLSTEITSSVVTLVSTTPQNYNGEKTIKRSRRSFIFKIAFVVCAVAFIIATGFLGFKVNKSNQQLDALQKELHNVYQSHKDVKESKRDEKRQDPICTTKVCVVAAATLVDAMDPTADPCQDFFQFACGGWVKKNGIPDNRNRVSVFGALNQQIYYFTRDFLRENNTIDDSTTINNTRNMYKECVNQDVIESLGVTPLVHLLESFGRWPMTVTNWTEDGFNWRKTTANIRNFMGLNYLIDVSNFIDVNNTEYSTIYIDQPPLDLPRELFKSDNLSSPALQVYAAFVAGAAVAVRDAIGSGAPNAAIIYDVQEMILFNVKLAQIFTPNEKRSRDLKYFYNPYILSELQNLTDQVNLTNSKNRLNWKDFLNDIYSVANVTMEDDERIIVVEPSYLQRLVGLLDQTPSRVIANYLHWRIVLSHISDLNIHMNILANEFWKALYGSVSNQPRLTMCTGRVKDVMGFAIGSRYIEKAFDPAAKTDMNVMIDHLKIAFSSLVEELDWMDQETKVRALEKAAAIREFIGYPDWIANKTMVDLAYQGIDVSPHSHFKNFVNVKTMMTRTHLKFLRFRIDKKNLFISFPAVVNAFYYPLMNSITFPAGILQPPFYGKGRLAALNYGSIGVVIGHEITHGFDHRGHKSDKDGRKISWWTNGTLTEFFKRTQCFVEQYGNYTFPELEGTEFHRINGSFTQGENIADNGGLREAFRAYENYVALNGREPRLPGLEQYSPEQIFFLSYANTWCGQQTIQALKNQIKGDPHSPARYRVIGPLSNSVDFINNFQCPTGAMNRVQKCVLW